VTTCRIAPGVHWVVGRTSLTLVDASGVARTLGYPDAAVWDFMSRGYPLSEVARLVAAVESVEPPAAEELVRASVAQWVAGGLLEQA
jgi:hypothetical protein